MLNGWQTSVVREAALIACTTYINKRNNQYFIDPLEEIIVWPDSRGQRYYVVVTNTLFELARIENKTFH